MDAGFVLTLMKVSSKSTKTYPAEGVSPLCGACSPLIRVPCPSLRDEVLAGMSRCRRVNGRWCVALLAMALGSGFACERSAPIPPPASTSGASVGAMAASPSPPPSSPAPAEQRWPVTCDEAAALAVSKMGPALEQRVRSLEKNQLIILHDSWGMGIRNEFGLWEGNKALLASCSTGNADVPPEPDPVARVIMSRAWEMLHGEREKPHGGR
jgi:hypothetical protein